MPWKKEIRKEKFAELDKRRRTKRRAYFNEYYHKKLKNDEKTIQKGRVKALTRFRYEKAKKCIICGSTYRVFHHHYTEPYEVDKFIDLCEYHHNILDFQKRYGNKTKFKKEDKLWKKQT